MAKPNKMGMTEKQRRARWGSTPKPCSDKMQDIIKRMQDGEITKEQAEAEIKAIQ